MNIITENLFKNPLKTLLFLLLPASILFIKTLGYEFTSLDEQWMIFKNVSFLEKWSGIKDAFTKPITDAYYRPLLMVSFIIDYHIGKLSPSIYHFTNLILHLVSVYLVFRVLVSFNIERKTSFLLALIFSIHPLVIHAVAWIPGRNDLILCVFTLLSLLHLNNFITQNKLKYLIFHILFFCCTLLSKENSIVLPLVFLFVSLINEKTTRKNIYIGALIWSVLTLLFLVIRNNVIPSTAFYDFSVSGLKDFLLAFIMFSGKTILPFYQSILPKVNMPSLLASLIGITIITTITFKVGLKDKKVAFLGLFIFIILLLIPVWFGAFKPGSEHYEHRSYTSLFGVMLFLSQIKVNVQSKYFQNILVAFLCVLFIKSFIRIKVYKSTKTFIEAGLKERPDYYLFYQQKGEALYKERKYGEATLLFTKAIKLRPDKAELYSNRGSSEFSMRMYKEAILDFSEAIKKSEFKMEYYLNRCITYNKIGDIPNAFKDYQILKKCCSDKIPASLKRSFEPITSSPY